MGESDAGGCGVIVLFECRQLRKQRCAGPLACPPRLSVHRDRSTSPTRAKSLACQKNSRPKPRGPADRALAPAKPSMNLVVRVTHEQCVASRRAAATRQMARQI